MGELVNKLSWSHSALKVYEGCAREYWLHKYGGWGGWEPGCDSETRTAYILKKLGNRFSWPGNAVHEMIEECVSQALRGQDVDPAKAVEKMLRRMRKDFAASKEKLFESNPKTFGLEEHFYDLPLEKWTGEKPWNKAEECARIFLENFWPSVEASIRMPMGAEEVLACETREEYEPILGVTAWLAADLARRNAHGDVVIDDWKTGKAQTEHADQMIGYAIWAAKKYGEPGPTSISLRRVYLKTGEVFEFTPTKQQVEDFQAEVSEQLVQIKALHDPDKERRNDFPKLPEGSKKCLWCKYRRICGRE